MIAFVLLSCAAAAPDPAPSEAPDSLQIGATTAHASEAGVSVSEVAWTLGGESGWAVVVQFPRAARMTVYPSAEVHTLDRFGTVSSGMALSNGGFYDVGAMGLVRHDGVDRSPLTENGGSGIVAWGAELPVSVIHRSAWTGQGSEALQSVDRIVDAGASLVNRKADARETARTGLGVTADSVFLVVAASNESCAPKGTTRILIGAESTGLPLWAFADVMVHLGAQQAINFDGGVSVGLRAKIGPESWTIDGGLGTINAVLLSTEHVTQ